MKKSFFILTVLFFTSYLFSMGSKNQRNFVKGNIIDKTVYPIPNNAVNVRFIADTTESYNEIKTNGLVCKFGTFGETNEEDNNPSTENVITTSSFTNGYIDESGNLVSADYFKTTDYLDISGWSKLTLNVSSRYALYDADKNFLHRNTSLSTEINYINPSAKYIRLTVKPAETSVTLTKNN